MCTYILWLSAGAVSRSQTDSGGRIRGKTQPFPWLGFALELLHDMHAAVSVTTHGRTGESNPTCWS